LTVRFAVVGLTELAARWPVETGAAIARIAAAIANARIERCMDTP
jgi:hypothetical protein